jgi:hypothetical protein
MKISQTELNDLIREELYSSEYMVNEGLGNEMIGILRGLGSGVTDTFKEEIAVKVLQYLEISTTSPMALIFINFIGNLSLNDIVKLLRGSNQCEDLVKELGDALAETIIEEIPATLGLAPKGRMGKVVREALSKSLSEDVSKEVSEALCNIDFLPLIEALPGGKMLRNLFFR